MHKPHKGASELARGLRDLTEAFHTDLRTTFTPRPSLLEIEPIPAAVVVKHFNPRLLALFQALSFQENLKLSPGNQSPVKLPQEIQTNTPYFRHFVQLPSGLFKPPEGDERIWTKYFTDYRFNLGFQCIPKLPRDQLRLSTLPVILFPFTLGDEASYNSAKTHMLDVKASQVQTRTPPEDGTPSVMTTWPQSYLVMVGVTPYLSKSDQMETASQQATIQRAVSCAKHFVSTSIKEEMPDNTEQKKTFAPDACFMRIDPTDRRGLNHFVRFLIMITQKKRHESNCFRENYSAYFGGTLDTLMRPLAVTNTVNPLSYLSRPPVLEQLNSTIKTRTELKDYRKLCALQAIRLFANNPCQETLKVIRKNQNTILTEHRYFYSLLKELISHHESNSDTTPPTSTEDKLAQWLKASHYEYPARLKENVVNSINNTKELKAQAKLAAIQAIRAFGEAPSSSTFAAIKAHRNAILQEPFFFLPLLAPAIQQRGLAFNLFTPPRDKINQWLHTEYSSYPDELTGLATKANNTGQIKRYQRTAALIAINRYTKEPHFEHFAEIQRHREIILSSVAYFWPLLQKIQEHDLRSDRCPAADYPRQKDKLERWLDDAQSREVFDPFHRAHRASRDYHWPIKEQTQRRSTADARPSNTTGAGTQKADQRRESRQRLGSEPEPSKRPLLT